LNDFFSSIDGVLFDNPHSILIAYPPGKTGGDTAPPSVKSIEDGAFDGCKNLANPIWNPVANNPLTGGSSYFSDPPWTNYPGRFYRLRSP